MAAHQSSKVENAKKLIEDIRSYGIKSQEMVLQPLTPQRRKLFDDIDSDFESSDEEGLKESTSTRSSPDTSDVPALAGSKRKAREERAEEDNDLPSLEKKPRIEIGVRQGSSRLPAETSSKKEPLAVIPSIPNVSSIPGGFSISPLTADTVSPVSTNTDQGVAHHYQPSNHQRSFREIRDNARKMKKCAEKMHSSSASRDDIVNIRSYAMSIRAGLMFVESAMVAAENGDIAGAISVLTETVKYFEFFASNFMKWNNPKLHMITMHCIAFSCIQCSTLQGRLHGDLLLEGSPLAGIASVAWIEFQAFISSSLASIASSVNRER